MSQKIGLTSFFKKVLTLGSGTAMAHVLLFLVTPLLTRLYTPNDLGTYAVFLSVASVFMAVSSGKLEMAIVLPKKDKEGVALLISSWLTHVFWSVLYYIVLLILCVFYKEGLNRFLNWGLWALAPIFGGLQLLFESLKQWALRKESLKVISKSNLIKSFATIVLQIGLAIILGSHAMALIIGLIGSLIFGNRWLWSVFKESYLKEPIEWSWQIYKTSLVKYKKFPLFTSPSILFNAFVLQMPVWILTKVSLAVVGFYNLAERIIQAPLLLVAHSVGQVFYRNAADLKTDAVALKELTWKVYRSLFYIILFPALLLSFWGAPLFEWVFGSSWYMAGSIAGFLAPQLVFNFCVSPISNLWYTFNRNQNAIYFQLILFIGRLTLLLLFWKGNIELNELFRWLGYYGALVYGGLGFLFLNKLGVSKMHYLLQIVVPFFLIFVLFKFL